MCREGVSAEGQQTARTGARGAHHSRAGRYVMGMVLLGTITCRCSPSNSARTCASSASYPNDMRCSKWPTIRKPHRPTASRAHADKIIRPRNNIDRK